MRQYIHCPTRIANFTIAQEDDAIVSVSFGFKTDGKQQDSPLLKEAAKQIKDYTEGKRKEFTIPCFYQGTPFQEKVWQAVRQIPYGETRSYSQIAKQIGAEKAARAVGHAMNKNPLVLWIPCHRVVSANGLGGYAGKIDIKIALLETEKSNLI